jgi:hypothetical protein
MGLFVIVAIYLRMIIRHRRRTRERPIDDDDDAPPPERTTGSFEEYDDVAKEFPVPFPWEPRPLSSGGGGDDATSTFDEISVGPVVQHRDVDARPTTDDDHDYDDEGRILRLMAGMTFANGGLRSPSCPCCR